MKLLCLATALVLLASGPVVVAEEQLEDVRHGLTQVEGVSVHATEEEPRVLHIVPWQAPSIPNRKREDVPLSGAEEVLQPLDVDAFRMHRQFRQTLDILNTERTGP